MHTLVVILICPKFHVMTLEIGFEIPESRQKRKRKVHRP